MGVTAARLNEVSGIIVDTAFHVHTALGPGLLESVYQKILAHELRKRGLKVDEEVPIPLYWEGIQMEIGFRADLVVEDLVLIELKSVEEVPRVFHKKLLTYLRLADKRLGLLLNFGAAFLRDGIVRVANGMPE